MVLIYDTINSPTMRRTLVVVYGLCLALAGYLFLFHLKTSPLNYWFNIAYSIIYLMAGIFGLLIARSAANQKPMYLFLSFGMFSFTLAEIVWSIYNLVLKTEIPYPGIPDIFYISYYVFMVIGFLHILKFLKVKITLVTFTETGIVFCALFSIIYLFLKTNLGPVHQGNLANLLNLAYPILDSLMISLAILATRSQIGILNNSLMYFVFGFILLAAGDTLFSFQTSFGTYWNGNLVDIYFATSGILIAFGILNLPEIISNVNVTDQTKI